MTGSHNNRPGAGILASGANRVALFAAVRGTLAAAVPFLVLRQAGYPLEALIATVAVLNISIADAGGPYRQRLAVMATIALLIPLVLVLGMRCRDLWWLPPVAMFVVAMAGGLARLLGTAGTSLGLITGVVFLIGIEVPGDWSHAFRCALSYLGGASWTLLITLALWRVRPYRRVRYEIGEIFSQLAVATHWLAATCTTPGSDCEAHLTAARSAVGKALEQAEQTLGEALSESASIPPFLSDLIVLVRAASRIQASMSSLTGALDIADLSTLSIAERKELRNVLQQIEEGCRNLAAGLLDKVSPYPAGEKNAAGKPWLAIELPTAGSAALEEAETFINVIRRQQEGAHRVLDRLAGHRHRMGFLPPLHGPSFPAASLAAIKANLTFRSLVFRHALRVAAATSVATGAYLAWQIPHGIWIPLTVLIVLQPQLGATVNKAIHRTGGTVLGAVLAGLLVLLFGHSAGIDAAILVCFFLTVLYLRRRYWVAVVFLTPLIILLLSLLVHHPWSDIIERTLNTLAGAALALASGYALWPTWEYRRLPDEIADATDANSRYLSAVLAAVRDGMKPGWPLAGLRAGAELGTSNARASLERMLTEPNRFHREAPYAIDLVTHLERLTRHATRLSIYLHQIPDLRLSVGTLPEAFEARLAAIGNALHQGSYLTPDDSLEQAYREARREWQKAPPNEDLDPRIVDTLISSVVADINSLQAPLIHAEPEREPSP